MKRRDLSIMLMHKGTQIINTDRLLLRRYELADANDMFKNWANDCEVTMNNLL